MKKLGVVVVAIAVVALTGCSASLASVADTCGGRDSGVFVEDDGSISYVEAQDAAGDGLGCVLRETLDDDAAMQVAQRIDSEPDGTITADGHVVRWTGTNALVLNISDS